jgi:translation initiation factor 1
LALDASTLGALAKQLKAACGSGGTVKDGVIEVQGDHVVVLMAALQKRGYMVRLVGG